MLQKFGRFDSFFESFLTKNGQFL